MRRQSKTLIAGVISLSVFAALILTLCPLGRAQTGDATLGGVVEDGTLGGARAG